MKSSQLHLLPFAGNGTGHDIIAKHLSCIDTKNGAFGAKSSIRISEKVRYLAPCSE